MLDVQLWGLLHLTLKKVSTVKIYTQKNVFSRIPTTKKNWSRCSLLSLKQITRMFLFAKEGDADSKIASTALELAKEDQVVVVADDTDLAVIQLCCYITGSRHFMPKSGHSNERVFCIRFDRALKMQFNEGSPQLPTTNRSQVMTVFLEPILHFFGQKKCINIRFSIFSL